MLNDELMILPAVDKPVILTGLPEMFVSVSTPVAGVPFGALADQFAAGPMMNAPDFVPATAASGALTTMFRISVKRPSPGSLVTTSVVLLTGPV